MKKILTLFAVILLSTVSAFASDTMKVKALTPLSTKNPTTDMSVSVIKDTTYKSYNFLQGYVLTGEMVDVIQPQKYGKNATFSFKITSYTDLNNKKYNLNEPLTVKYRQQIKPNYERSTISSGNVEFSPYDITLMKESKSVGEFIKKDLTKDSFWQPGWDIKIKSGETFSFNLPE